MTLGWRTELKGGLPAFGPSDQEWAQGLLEQAQGMENEAKELRSQIQTLRSSFSLMLKIRHKQIGDSKQQMNSFRVMLRPQKFFGTGVTGPAVLAQAW
jgi:hypothetical protein